MTVTLLHHTPLEVCVHAIRTCHNSFDKSDNGGEKDKELIYRVGNKLKHSSTLEHLVYTFDIKGISRACLQELSRHRIASLSVKSTRYTLKELKDEEPFNPIESYTPTQRVRLYQRVLKYIVIPDLPLLENNLHIKNAYISALENLRKLVASGVPNDIAKYALPECYKTELTWTINARSLQNFLSLRTDKSALWEMQELAHEIYKAIPPTHQYLFKDYLKEQK